LVTTAKREALRLHRDLARSAGSPDDCQLGDGALLPDESMELLERQAALERALEELDERCARLVTALFYAPKDRSYAQIAEETGVPFNSLGPVRRRCLERLRRLLEDNHPVKVRKTI
jgi:RNA polymerase sigma factor (sigma-70 family)